MSSESAALALKRLQELRSLREQTLGQQGQPQAQPQYHGAELTRRTLEQAHRPREERNPSVSRAQELLARSAQLRQQPGVVEPEPVAAPSAVGIPQGQAVWPEQPSQFVNQLPITSSPAESDATEWSAYSVAFDRRASDASYFDGVPAAHAPSAAPSRYQFRGTPTKLPAAAPAVASPRRTPPPGSPDEAHPSTGQIQPPADWAGPILKQMKKTKQWKVRTCRLDAAGGRLQLHDGKKVRKPDILNSATVVSSASIGLCDASVVWTGGHETEASADAGTDSIVAGPRDTDLQSVR